ncbi:MAG TPA: histidine phosphatase family protein [Acetobacteraceae bacterium]|nr:histidine phosphatase family protein [Acetobacteraceae bacterium]
MNHEASAGTRIVLVRHGHVEGIDPPRFRGQTDLPLTVRGIQQAEKTRDLLAALPPPAAAYASPLSRCMKTAEIIASPWSRAITPMPSFLDIDYGDWQGRPYHEVQQADPARFARWFDTPHLAVMPGGETLLGLAARVAETMRAILANHRGDTVLLVGHDTVNRVLLLLALDLPLSRFWHLRQDPCAVNVVAYDEARGWRVESMNEASHLRRLR